MQLKHRSKEYPKDKNKYKKKEDTAKMTSLPLPDFVPPSLPTYVQQVIDETPTPIRID
jgi:hypothetical protein